MVKVIKLVMNADRSIGIMVNEKEKATIEPHNRSISADKIYEIFEFTSGDQYSVVTENVSEVDNHVIEFFADLLKDVAKKVNMIAASNSSSPIT